MSNIHKFRAKIDRAHLLIIFQLHSKVLSNQGTEQIQPMHSSNSPNTRVIEVTSTTEHRQYFSKIRNKKKCKNLT